VTPGQPKDVLGGVSATAKITEMDELAARLNALEQIVQGSATAPPAPPPR
jgi:hypothetical protein